MSIPLSHIRQYLHREYISHNSICIENISHTTLFASDPQVPDCRRRLWVDMFALLTSLRQLPVSEEHTTVCILTQRERPFFFVCKEVLQKYCKSIAKVLRQSQSDTFPFLSRCKPHTSWRSQGWRFPKVHRLDFLRFTPARCSRWHGEWVGWQSIAIVFHSVTKYCTSIAKCDKVLH